jgi:hypothetical protein
MVPDNPPLGDADPAYTTLIARPPLRPTRVDAKLAAAAVAIHELTDRDDLSFAESDYLDVLRDLVQKFENEHVEMPHPDPGGRQSSTIS